MEKGKNLAIFDFCDTLVKLQSADEFSRYILKKESRWFYFYLDRLFEKFLIYRIIQKIPIKFYSQKELLLRALKGISKSKIENYGFDFVQEVIEKKINKEVFKRFKNHIKRGDDVIINSGGYEPYLTHFSRKYQVNLCFSTRFEYEDYFFTGKIQGKDCLGIEKVLRMKELEVVYENYATIYVYSDSITDMPLFDLATHKIAIIKNYTTPKWCQSNFEIIKV
jgi:HAD superfamily hydrolase (TIGR01490 family)